MEWLNYHHLLYFYTVAREGSVVRASEVLHLAQPTLSGQIRKLEQALDEKLFERRGRNLVLTEMGRVAYRYADEIFSLGRELTETLRGQPTKRPQALHVGIADVVPKLVVHRLLAASRLAEAGVRLVLREGKTDDLLAALATQAFDLVISDAPVSPHVKVRAFNHLLGESSITFLASPALARRHRARFPKSLDGAPMLLPTDNTALRRSLDKWFQEIGVRPRVREAVQLFEIVGFQPPQAATGGADGEGRCEKDEDVRISDALPHVGNVGMLLRDVAATIPLGLQCLNER